MVVRTDPEANITMDEVQGPSSRFGADHGTSFSGHERNHIFSNRGGAGFDDVSIVSGFDHPADGRSIAAFDYDRDGRPDLAVVNANAPLLQVFHNEIEASPGRTPTRFVAVRFRGGNTTAAPTPGLSNRDGVGARLELHVGDKVLRRELRAGEGFASQSSATLLIGLGDAKQADKLTVRWPSGRITERADVAAGQLVTAWEDRTAKPFNLQVYGK